jgi:hypothetical protein
MVSKFMMTLHALTRALEKKALAKRLAVPQKSFESCPNALHSPLNPIPHPILA